MNNKQINNFYIKFKNFFGNNYPSVHEPIFFKNEKKYVKKCIETTFVSSTGKYVNLFEKKIAAYTKSKYAIATVNGTAGLHISYLLAGIKKNDEVLVPSFTFPATVNALTYCDAIPHFVDIDENSLGIDFVKLNKYLKKNTSFKKNKCFNKKTKRFIKAIVPVYPYGHPYNINEIKKIANKYKLKLVEDAAGSLGSFYKGRHSGTFGLMGVLSFNGNKTITTGGGGIILTNDIKIAKLAKYLTNVATKKNKFSNSYEDIGYNYRMPNINAALGCAQLENVKKIIKMKRDLYFKYKKIINNESCYLFKEMKNNKSNYWLHLAILKSGKAREKILKKFHKHNIKIIPSWKPLHDLRQFKIYPKMNLKCTNDIAKRIICLPSSSSKIYKLIH